MLSCVCLGMQRFRTKSTISRVKLQSNSLTVHLTCNSTSKRCCSFASGMVRPWYRCLSSRALVVSGVCTCTAFPFLSGNNFGLPSSRRVFSIRCVLLAFSAARFRRSTVWSSLISYIHRLPLRMAKLVGHR